MRIPRSALSLSVLAAAALLASAPSALRADDGTEGGAAAADEKPRAEVGGLAPDFTLKDQEGNEVSLSSYRGRKNVVVAFYPKVFTAGCTKEMKCLNADWRKVEERGATVLALSGDAQEEVQQFAKSLGSRFPMLSDKDLAVAKAYGVYVASPGGGYAGRSVFLVDTEGRIRWMDKDFVVPRTLDKHPLLAELDKLRPDDLDPAAALAKLPSPDKEAKTVLVRYVQALLAEDVPAVDALLHKEFGWMPNATPAMTTVKRKAEIERLRKLFEQEDLKALEFRSVLDPRDGQTLAKGQEEDAGALAGFSADAKRAVSELPEGDVMLVCRTKAPLAGPFPLLKKETWVQLRKDGEAWKIVNLSGR